MEFGALGPLQVSVADDHLDLGSPLQRKVLAVLLTHRNNKVSRRALIADVWSGDAAAFDLCELEDRKRGVLQTYIARLRVALQPAARAVDQPELIVTEGANYGLLLPDNNIDETRFRNLLLEGRETLAAGGHAAAADRLRRGLALWRGRPLGEFCEEPFARQCVVRLDALRLSGIEAWLTAELHLGHHYELIADTHLRQWLQDYPESEGLRLSLALALYRCGQTAAAAATCREGIAYLRERRLQSTRLSALLDDLHSGAGAVGMPSPASVSVSQSPSRPSPTPQHGQEPQMTDDRPPETLPTASPPALPPPRRSAPESPEQPAATVPSWAGTLSTAWQTYAATAATIAVALIAITASTTLATYERWVAGLVTGSAMLVIAARAHRALRGTEVSTHNQTDDAVEALARMVQRQWRDELAVRQLHDPHPMTVHWRPSALDITDHQEIVEDTLSGRTDHIDELVRAYRRLRWRRLVVLGAPGSGKTTLAILLTVAMSEQRQQHDPVPLLLSLSTWQPEQEHLHAWIRRRIAEDYPALGDAIRFGAAAVSELVADRRVIPVLDGLDELPDARRPAALAAINRVLTTGDELVLTCRTAEYRAAVSHEDVLTGAAVIEAAPVAIADTITFLRQSTAPGPRMERWQDVFQHLIDQPDGPLATALSSPLMVMLIRLIYAKGPSDPRELLDTSRFPDHTAIENHFLDALIPTLLSTGEHRDPELARHTRSWEPAAARRWFGFLATHMGRLRTYDYAWWNLAQAGSALAHRRSRALLVGLASWVVATGCFSVAGVLIRGFEQGLVTGAKHGLAYGLGTGVAVLVGYPGAPAHRYVRHRPTRRRFAMTMLGTGLASGATFGVVSGVAATLKAGVGVGIVNGIAYGLTFSVVIVLGYGIADLLASADAPTRVNLRIRGRGRSLVRHLSYGVAVGSAAGLTIGIVEQLARAVAVQHGVVLAPGLQLGLRPGYVWGLVMGILFYLVKWARTPLESEKATSPDAVLKADRSLYLTVASLCIAALILASTLATLLSSPGYRGWAAVGWGLAAGGSGAVLGIVMLGSTTAWPVYSLARGWLALRGQLPWRLTAFLADAYQLGILRQVGAVYQFRHARLQERLIVSARTGRSTNAGPLPNIGAQASVPASSGLANLPA